MPRPLRPEVSSRPAAEGPCGALRTRTYPTGSRATRSALAPPVGTSRPTAYPCCMHACPPARGEMYVMYAASSAVRKGAVRRASPSRTDRRGMPGDFMERSCGVECVRGGVCMWNRCGAPSTPGEPGALLRPAVVRAGGMYVCACHLPGMRGGVPCSSPPAGPRRVVVSINTRVNQHAYPGARVHGTPARPAPRVPARARPRRAPSLVAPVWVRPGPIRTS